eukprot:CAMPEP_0114525416 /NCGR_PEP_ID=MMETSP0109-20121206/22408_1 /TAXON_ID=29199 /ORGANISM="Chlorarachnion reptans, Strain CCCM449" /LENGTH=201 /DNA_ID=CAMNT_0001706987 /DNA_START=55 /DNA_END=660 /DNA_ORIENTATION=+
MAGPVQVHPPEAAKQSSLEAAKQSSQPRCPRKYTIRNQRQAWTTEEHKRFLDGIRIYKRDWSKVTAHVGTRTVVQIRSHAQKHFIKLKRQGKGNQIPPRRNKDRREEEYRLARANGTLPFKKRSAETDEKRNHEARESKNRTAKRMKTGGKSSLTDISRNGTFVKGFIPSPPSIKQENRGPVMGSRDINAGIQALLLLSRG